MRPGHVWTPWTELETKALLEAVYEYGLGQWAVILKDDTYGPILINRSNVDLKDKWRVLERARLRSGQPSLLQLYPSLLINSAKSRAKRTSSASVIPTTLARNTSAVAVVATAIDDKDEDPLQSVNDANHSVISESKGSGMPDAPRTAPESSQRAKRKSGPST